MPSIHRKYIDSMVGMFGDSAAHCIHNMRPAATGGLTVDMENYYSRLALDIIGKACASPAVMCVCINDGKPYVPFICKKGSTKHELM